MNNNNERPRRNNRQGGRRRKVCNFCVADHKNPEVKQNLVIDYKNSDLLRKFISDRGKISPRRITGTCAKHQRELTIAIKRSRHVALLPFSRD